MPPPWHAICRTWVDILGRRKLVIAGGNQDVSIHILEISLALVICRHSGMNDSLELARLVVIVSVIEHYLRTRNRLTVGSIHHHIAMPVIRQLLDHHRQIADIEAKPSSEVSSSLALCL